jgi:uncharacterized membrane protein
MVKKELKPLEVNGITAVTIGTFLWLIALIVLLSKRTWLIQNNHENWTYIAASGMTLGLLGYRYTTNRLKRIKSTKDPDQSSLIHDFE